MISWETTKKWIFRLGKSFGILIALSGVYGLYLQLAAGPRLISQMVGEANVLDVHQPVDNLQVLFRGTDIQEADKNLKIYRVNFTNTGTTNITQGEFDQYEEWGIRVDGGNIVEARLIDTDSDYIRNNLNPRLATTTNNSVIFEKIIFDKGTYFTIELVILHEKNTSPSLYQMGKIAGIKEVGVQISPYRDEEGFIAAVISGIFHGNWKIALARFGLNFIASIVLLFIIVLIIAKVQSERMKAKQVPQRPQQPAG